MSSIIKEEWCCLRSRVDGVVVGKLEEVQVLVPVVLSAVDKSAKAFYNRPICPLDLAVALGVVGGCVDHLGSKCSEHVFPEARCKLRTLVGEESMGKPVMAKDMLDEKARCPLCGKLLRACGKAKHFAEFVHEHQDARIFIWGRG